MTYPSFYDARGRELACCDSQGWFADLTLEARGLTTQLRFRWVPPGTFAMGSPDSEFGRFGDEGPMHEVTISSGLWLSDAPCTQATWRAVMGPEANPSLFVSPERPVERVSAEDVVDFMKRLGSDLPGVRLPTEAEWEYACRAGTTTATFEGDFNAELARPCLDRISWYGSNCGADADFPIRDRSRTGQEGGTHPVRGRAPNPWGLYDMLGNVEELCADSTRTDAVPGRPYRTEAIRDPLQSVSGPRFVVARGGSWADFAVDLRASKRGLRSVDDRLNTLGFRIARASSPRPLDFLMSRAPHLKATSSDAIFVTLTPHPGRKIADTRALQAWASSLDVSIEVATQSGGRAEVSSVEVSRQELESLHQLSVDNDPRLHDDNARRAAVGEALMTTIKGSGSARSSWLTRLSQVSLGEKVGVRTRSVDLVVQSDDEEILNWAWRTLRYNGSPLERLGWAISQCREDAQWEPIVRMSSACEVLVVAADLDPSCCAHIKDIRDVLRERLPGCHIKWVKALADLQALDEEFQPALVYIYGHGVEGRDPQLVLDQQVSVDDLHEVLLPRSDNLRLTYLNACDLGARGPLGGGRLLSPLCPYVFVNPVEVDSARTRELGRKIIDAILEGTQPQDALAGIAGRLGGKDRINPTLWRTAGRLVLR